MSALRETLIDGRPAGERCARCGHTWNDHTWIVDTECWHCRCRFYIPPYTAEELAAQAERLKGWKGRDPGRS